MTVEGDVNGLLANPQTNFRHIDRLIVYKFDANILSKIGDFFFWLEEQRNIGKEIIRNETGRIRLPKTPKRGYCFSQEAETFQKCRKKLLDSVTRKAKGAFANDGNTAIYAAQTPKSSRNAAAQAVKQEAVLAGRMNDRRIPIRPVPAFRQCTPKQQTSIKVNKHPPVTTSCNSTPKRTPLRSAMTPRIGTQKVLIIPEAVAQKAIATPKAVVERTVDTPKIADKKIAVTPKPTVQQPAFKRSEVIRKMEKRTNTVIKNKEELMKEKAERARRDREERALRVKMNNKKKEEEALEKLRIIKMREQQIEELRQKQRVPQRAISKSPCRTRGYYNRIQKPLVRAKSSQDVSASKNVLQEETIKNRQEHHQFQGKRNHFDSVKQDTDMQNKKQKLDLVESSEIDSSNTHSIKTDTPEVLDRKHIDDQNNAECDESDDKRSFGERRTSRSDMHVTTEPTEIPTVSKQEMLASVQNCDVNPDAIMHSPAVESSEINGKENMDESSQDMEIDILSAETSTISNGTFNKSVNVSNNETLDGIGNNYDVESISSNDETDDEENPRKPIPLWAQGERLKNALRKQVAQPSIDPDVYFGPVRTPMLDKIFARNRTRYNKRTSSAVWTSPMSNPKKGTSRFFELQNISRGSKL
uniref:INCENP_ARK-bind domain-containing protein n=1 Tax=Elaeophora elaphi TaxID=1147741 RepID=A0A0R3RGQ0_9BILA